MGLRFCDIDGSEVLDSLKIDCENCFGLCCVALFFSKSEGFPQDKVAGKPCVNLLENFGCAVHNELRNKGLKGCTAYDCFGAGQKVAQVTFKSQDWNSSPQLASKMFDVFVVMRQLHEMLWYLVDASTFVEDDCLKNELSSLIKETNDLTLLDDVSILKVDVDSHRMKVNSVLRKVNGYVGDKLKSYRDRNSKNKKKLKSGYDFIGANLVNTNLIGANFAGALLIASNMRGNDLSGANLIGADLRDADVRGANLEDVLFLTQSQINSARGDATTKLPKYLVRPFYWE